ncbi:MAG: energy transducer TonB [Pseudomonadota bacterium]
MLSNPLIRIAIGVPAAAIIVFILFQMMNWMITIKELNLEEKEQRVLEAITPQRETNDARRNARTPPKRLDAANKPPPPPKLSSSKSQIDLPTPDIQGAAPSDLGFARVEALSIDPVAISDRDAQPIRPPVPTYPQRAAERGIEGSCDVRFDVDVRGRPYNVQADCTDRVFNREAVRAVEKVEFAPKIIRGQPAERRNVVYPLEFQLEQ